MRRFTGLSHFFFSNCRVFVRFRARNYYRVSSPLFFLYHFGPTRVRSTRIESLSDDTIQVHGLPLTAQSRRIFQ